MSTTAPTIGIEEEHLLVDARSGALVPRSEVVLAAAGGDDRVTAELNRCQIEVVSGVCATLDDAQRELDDLRRAAEEAARGSGTLAVPLASHPFSSWEDQRINLDKAHYVALRDDYRQVVQQQVVCGQHVHVAVPPELRVPVMDRLRPWLAVLLALSANSPYWEGRDTGYASWRTVVWRTLPTATTPPVLGDDASYRATVGRLEALGIVDSPQSVCWYVRPSERFDTLELRICDTCLRADDAVTLAGLMRALVVVAVDEATSGASVNALDQPTVDGAVWRAARYGLGDRLVDPIDVELRPAADVVGRLVEVARPGLEHAGDVERVTDGVAAIVGRGNGADLQRRAVAGGGPPAAVIGRILGSAR